MQYPSSVSTALVFRNVLRFSDKAETVYVMLSTQLFLNVFNIAYDLSPEYCSYRLSYSFTIIAVL